MGTTFWRAWCDSSSRIEADCVFEQFSVLWREITSLVHEGGLNDLLNDERERERVV